jgi:D-lactate dehydrogenase
MKIAVFETEEWEHQACLRLQGEHVLVCTAEVLNESIAADHSDAEVVSPFVNSRLDAGVLARLPRLKLIATRSTGYDHIDLDYCRAHGITVCNVPDYGDSTVAEHVFALLLAISRHLIEAVQRTRRGVFGQADLRGFELKGRRLGVIGTGRIGRRVIAIAKGFGMDVVAFDTAPDDAAARRLGFRYTGFGDVLAEADILTLHVPSSPATAHLISDREFAAMKPGAILINTARGNIVNTAALVRALTSGKIRAAGLDVLPQEPLLRDEAEIFRGGQYSLAELHTLLASNVLLRFPNVLVTPHNAYNTEDAVHRIIETTLANIEAFARGNPQNVVP